jgi:hypothetical protein
LVSFLLKYEKFEDTRHRKPSIEGQAIQWQRETGQTMIRKTLKKGKK